MKGSKVDRFSYEDFLKTKIGQEVVRLGYCTDDIISAIDGDSASAAATFITHDGEVVTVRDIIAVAALELVHEKMMMALAAIQL